MSFESQVNLRPGGAGATGPPSGDRELYLAAVLAGDRQAALDAALGAVARGTSVLDLYVDVLQEALYEVGRLWESNRISVAVEHLATAITQGIVTRLYEHLPRPSATSGRAVLTGVEGELHQVGGLMVADALESDGWDVRFLGAGVPVPLVLEAVSEHGPAILAVTCTLPQNVAKVAFLVRTVRAAFGEAAPRVLVGGGAFRAAPWKVAEVGADGWGADLRGAVEAARALAAAQRGAA